MNLLELEYVHLAVAFRHHRLRARSALAGFQEGQQNCFTTSFPEWVNHWILLPLLRESRKVSVVPHPCQPFISIFFHLSHCGDGVIISHQSFNSHCLDDYELEYFFMFASHLDILLCDVLANFSIVLSASLLVALQQFLLRSRHEIHVDIRTASMSSEFCVFG